MTTSLPSSHAWSAAQRLTAEFPTVPPTEIAHVLIDARRAVDLFGLSIDDELVVAETIARDRLIDLTRDHVPGAQLEPEPHNGRTEA